MEPIEKCMLERRRVIKLNVIDTTIEEIGFGVNLCNIPSKEDPEGVS